MKINFENLIKKNLTKNIPFKKKILITGCSGFIGNYLLQALAYLNVENKNIIHGIDIIKPKINIKNFTFYKKNLLKITPQSIPSVKYDYVIHLAGIPSPTYYKKNPLGTIFLNANLSEILLKKSRKDKSKFIYFSSSEIYGNPDPNNIPTAETYNGYVSSVSDRSCYDESKRMGETLTYVYKNKFNVDCKIIRPFNFYGNGMRHNDKRIIPQFFYQAINTKKITVFDNGKQTRTYCHIFDASVMILKIIFSGKQFIYNVGNSDEEISAFNIANKVVKKFKEKKIKIVKVSYPKNYPSDEPRRRCPNIYRFTKEFKYKPKVKLDIGLNMFREYALKKY
tara:strand:- start:289 stop:1299 length:1011 start_codon:yes stop_codon:yes gene_type:complete